MPFTISCARDLAWSSDAEQICSLAMMNLRKKTGTGHGGHGARQGGWLWPSALCKANRGISCLWPPSSLKSGSCGFRVLFVEPSLSTAVRTTKLGFGLGNGIKPVTCCAASESSGFTPTAAVLRLQRIDPGTPQRKPGHFRAGTAAIGFLHPILYKATVCNACKPSSTN